MLMKWNKDGTRTIIYRGKEIVVGKVKVKEKEEDGLQKTERAL